MKQFKKATSAIAIEEAPMVDDLIRVSELTGLRIAIYDNEHTEESQYKKDRYVAEVDLYYGESKPVEKIRATLGTYDNHCYKIPRTVMPEFADWYERVYADAKLFDKQHCAVHAKLGKRTQNKLNPHKQTKYMNYPGTFVSYDVNTNIAQLHLVEPTLDKNDQMDFETEYARIEIELDSTNKKGLRWAFVEF